MGGKKEKQDASKLSLKEEQTRLAEFTARFQVGFGDTDSSSWTRGAVVPPPICLLMVFTLDSPEQRLNTVVGHSKRVQRHTVSPRETQPHHKA